MPVGLGITVVDGVPVGKETREDEVVVKRSALLVEGSGVSLVTVPLPVSV